MRNPRWVSGLSGSGSKRSSRGGEVVRGVGSLGWRYPLGTGWPAALVQWPRCRAGVDPSGEGSTAGVTTSAFRLQQHPELGFALLKEFGSLPRSATSSRAISLSSMSGVRTGWRCPNVPGPAHCVQRRLSHQVKPLRLHDGVQMFRRGFGLGIADRTRGRNPYGSDAWQQRNPTSYPQSSSL